ncbi:hypothetical protein ACQEVC_34295 [Plantactinospora sp. CA-294935]|uniref:hypothetical protein n=1 Tax=Plantactinospora sp. CA-294935 TaxID=3240012 RepID=UPI003D8CC34B
MIAESYYWRRDLYRSAAELRRKEVQQYWSDASVALLEKALMIGSYSVRRLMDSNKLPRAYAERTIPAVALSPLPINKRRYRYTPPIDLPIASEMFDFTSGNNQTIKVGFFLNQIIHSHTLLYGVSDEDSTTRVFILVSSDKDRWSHLRCFWVKDVALLFEHAALFDMTIWKTIWSEADQDWFQDGAGQLSDQWDFAKPEAITESLVRLTRKQKAGPNLRLALRRIQEAIDEAEEN